jgi:hypothetical protein
MHLRVTDFFRRKSEGFGDRRHGNDGRVDVEADPLGRFEKSVVDAEGVELEGDDVRELADDLDPSLAWALANLAVRIAAGWRLPEAAAAAGVSFGRAARLLDELQDELGDRPAVAVEAPERWTKVYSGPGRRKKAAQVA